MVAVSSLRELQRAQSGVFADSDLPPIHFGDLVAEAHAAHESAALFDLSDWSHIEIAGADRKSFLHNFCTNDINPLAVGAGCEAFLTNIKGRILAHVLVSATDEALRLMSVPGSAAGVVEHLDRYLITEDVQIRDLTESVAALCLVGPQAAAVVHDQFGIHAGDLAMYAGIAADNAPADIIRVPLAPRPAFLLRTEATSIADLWQRLSGDGVQPAGSETWNTLRIAAGFPVCGVDISEENIAQEAGRTEQAISFTKGCYLGQEPIARLDALGHVNRVLCSLRLATTDPVPPGATVLDDAGDQEVGSITSSASDHLAGDVVALAMLKASSARPDAKVSLSVADGSLIVGAVCDGK